MPDIKVKGRDGARYTVPAYDGRPLMDTLRDETRLQVLGTCGGMCSCGTCHVYVAEGWLARLPPRTEDEQMMLEAIGELVEVKPTSRLSCQIPMDDSLDGLEIEIGPVA